MTIDDYLSFRTLISGPRFPRVFANASFKASSSQATTLPHSGASCD